MKDKDIRFGVEIELSYLAKELFLYEFKQPVFSCSLSNEECCNKISQPSVFFKHCYKCRQFSEFRIKSDYSIKGRSPGEITTPILKGKEGLEKLKYLCTTLEYCVSSVNDSCGLHIHIDASCMSDAQIIQLMKIYQREEDAIDARMHPNRRGNNCEYCKSLKGIDFDSATCLDDLYKLIPNRGYKVNIYSLEKYGTIEFRHHHGTFNYEEIRSWIEFIMQMIKRAKA